MIDSIKWFVLHTGEALFDELWNVLENPNVRNKFQKNLKSEKEMKNASFRELMDQKCKIAIVSQIQTTIAAYSTCVPTLVLGYSIKSRGIAKDIFGTEKEYVLSVDSLINEDELLLAYQKLFEKRENIKAYLKAMMPQYIQSAYDLKQILDVM